MSQEIVAQLKDNPALEKVPENQLDWLIENSECREFKAGEMLFDSGSPIDEMHVILQGRFLLKIKQNNQFRVVGQFDKHDIFGVLPYSRATNSAGRGDASEDTKIVSLHKSKFEEMIRNHHELTTALVHIMSSRIREFTKRQQQDDKMMSLGKLSAGLAHELNNPSAAVVRSARELKKHLGFLPVGFKKVIQIKTTEEEVDQVNEILFAKIDRKEPDSRSMMEKADLEDEILDWLDEYEVEEGADVIAEILAAFDFSLDDLEAVKDILREEDLFPVINWFTQVLVTEKLVTEIEDASERIGNLVGSIKSYTHMDQSPEKKATDIHVGIRNTITMLNHKVKRGQVELIENFDPELPRPKVLVSELNQVWTNIIDNAIDAMETSDEKKLEIQTIQDGEFINVHIKDSGKGIPEDVRDKIFDPFFTTKAVGKGTGLGLDVVHQIVTQHNGMVYVNSKPGETIFTICLPIN